MFKENPKWKPAVAIDLYSCSGTAFQEAIKALKAWSDSQPQEECPITENGWYDITPQLGEKLIRRNKKNRTVSLATVKKYGRRMIAKNWRKTGQAGIMCEGELYDMQHRLYAGYFTGCTFPCYMIIDVPPQDDLFAYIDDSKPRSGADALFTAGLGNGLSSTITSTVKLAWRYEHGALGWLKQPPIRTMDNDEVINYTRNNSDLVDACHNMVTNFSRAVKIINNKGIAGLVTWKITTLHGPEILEEFLNPLGSGAQLDEDSPILALRNRLLQAADENADELKLLHRLALIIKAFNMHVGGKKMGRNLVLGLRDTERYPLFEDAVAK